MTSYFLSLFSYEKEKTNCLKARFLWIQCCILSSTCSHGRAERTHTHIETWRTYSNIHSRSSSGSHALCGRVICIIMKLGVVSLLEAGGCVLSTACRTSALLADFDLAHWDRHCLCENHFVLFIAFNKDCFSSLFLQINLLIFLLKKKSSVQLSSCMWCPLHSCS